jgi:aryl-alcohol dehydrogenase-like predicted oxidoreductase
LSSLPKRNLGTTGFEVSELGFGAWPIGGTMYGPVDENEAIECVKAYLAAGGNFIDTARRYGQSEAVLGKVLSQCTNRDRIILATKTFMGDCIESIPKIRSELEDSLRLLQTDYVDLYYLHMPADDPEIMNYALDEFEALKKEGKIRAIGASIKGPAVTGQTVNLCRQYIDSGRVDVIQVVYSILRQRCTEIFDYAHRSGVGVVARTSIESGFLSGKYRPGHLFTESHRRRWEAVTQRRIFDVVAEVEAYAIRPPYSSLAQVAIRFALEPMSVSSVIVGAKSAGQAQMNTAVASLPPLDADIMERLKREFAGMTEGFNPAK